MLQRLLIILFFTGLLPVHTSTAQTDSTVVVRRARLHIDSLTSPAMAGRGYGAGGHRRAADYIRRQFEQIGLQPVDGSYEQSFDVRSDVVMETPLLTVDGRRLEPGVEFLPLAGSAAGTSAQAAPVVTVGPGLVLPRQERDDYAGVDVDGAVVVMDSRIPEPIRDDSTIPRDSYARSVRIAQAEDRGARAVILLVDRLVQGAYSPHQAEIPVFQVERSARPDEGSRISYRLVKERGRAFTTQNVLGRVEGTVHADSTIILMAHYDHVGSFGDSLYFPGANDNASGVALLLSFARYFESNPLPYSLLFVAFSGEEIGLRGSRHFVANPPIRLSTVAFILNFDMVASGNGVMAVGGVDFPVHFERLQRVNQRLDAGPLGQRRNAANSDHYFFLERGIPGFFLYTQAGAQPYHHIRDVPATLEWEDFWHVYRLGRGFLEQLAEQHVTPVN